MPEPRSPDFWRAAEPARPRERPTPHLVGLVADDLTGATDSAVQFAAAGWSAHLLRTAAATPEGDHPGPTVPAVSTGGQVLVDGVPVARSPARLDPVTPVTESRLDRLVPGATAATLSDLSALGVDGICAPEGRVVHVDAASDDDLAEVAATVDRLGAQAVPVGSAGLAAAMALQWSARRLAPKCASEPCARILVGVSSVHPAATQAVQRLRTALADRAAAHQTCVHVITTPTARAESAAIAAAFANQVAAQRRRHDPTTPTTSITTRGRRPWRSARSVTGSRSRRSGSAAWA